MDRPSLLACSNSFQNGQGALVDSDFTVFLNNVHTQPFFLTLPVKKAAKQILRFLSP